MTAHLGLTDIGTVDHGATDAVKYLFQAVGRTVVSSQYNTNVSCMVVEHARDMVKAVNECINKVENSTAATADDWDSFDKFSNAIDPLEDLLYKLLPLADDDKKNFPATFSAGTTPTSACVLSAETWAIERKEICEILTKLYADANLRELLTLPEVAAGETNRKEAQKHDDRAVLEEMKAKINAFLSKDSKKKTFPAHVHGIDTPLKTLQGAVIGGSPGAQDWALVTTIKTSMLIGGVMEIVEAAATDLKTRKHLKSKPVWDAASELIAVLNAKKTEQAKPGSELPQDVKAAYDAFLNSILESAEITLPASYVDLIKQVAQIRRPFQAQAITVVMLCHLLAKKFDANKSAITNQNYGSLETAFNETLTVLQSAATAVSDQAALKTFDMSNFKTDNTTVKAFGEANKRIKESFLSLGLTWGNDEEKKLSDAVKNDEERLTQLKGRLGGETIGPAEKKVKVTVTIHQTTENGNDLGNTSVDEVETMRLSALRWNVAGVLNPNDNLMKRARTAGKFFQKDSTGKWLEVNAHSTLAKIPSTDANGVKEVALKLVVPAP